MTSKAAVVFFIFSLAIVPGLSRAEVNPQEPMTCENRIYDFVTPNQNHEILRSFEGKWTAKFTFRLGADLPNRTFDAVVESRMIMGGRYLEQNFKGVNKDYEAKQTYGHDNLRREFSSSWYDNMSTGVITTVGHYDPQTKTLQEEGTLSCPFTDQPHRWFRAVTRFIDSDHRTYEMIKRDEEGDEFRSMLIEFTRLNEGGH